MKEFVEKLIERLEEYKDSHLIERNSEQCMHCQEKDCAIGEDCTHCIIDKAKEIVNQLAEEYNPSKSSDLAEQIADDLSKVLKEAKSMGCKEVKYFHHVPLENVEIVINALRAYNGKNDSELIEKINFAIEASNTNDNYMTGLRNGMRYCLALIDGKEPEFETCNQDSTEKNQGWILCSERLPEEEEVDVLVSTKAVGVTLGLYTKRYGYGMQEGFITNHGFVTLKNALAWQPLPEDYKPTEKQEEPQPNFYTERFKRVN